MSVKNAMTADFLRSAYGGESMAHMRYLIWGEEAENSNYPNIGRLFKAIAYSEHIHAKKPF
ncbi:rubrerythrin [Clostridium acetobutylicum]|nr:rubrerythrin [Clostridium acetobutylicum]